MKSFNQKTVNLFNRYMYSYPTIIYLENHLSYLDTHVLINNTRLDFMHNEFLETSHYAQK